MGTTSDFTTSDLTRMRYITRNYGAMQGLRLVPWGVAVLVATPLYGGWHFTQSGLWLALWLLPFAVGLGLYGLVGVYYARTFGRVRPAHRLTIGQRAALWVALVVVAFLLPRGVSPHLMLAVFSVAAVVATALQLWRTDGLPSRAHWVVLVALLAAVNLPLLLPLPLLRPERWSAYTLLALWLASWSLCLIVGGLLDHRLLVRTLAPAPEAEAEEAHAPTL